MIRINLLPHREEARTNRRQQFYVFAVLVLMVGGLIALVVHTMIQLQVDAQQSNNDFLKNELAQLDTEIVEIKRLREQTQSLLSRKQVIELLQSHRAETVYVFNELARQVPEGVYIRTLTQSGLKINLIGYAQSNARVSTLMRNLDGSPAFEKPELVEISTIESKTAAGRKVSQFNLYVSIRRQAEADPKKGGPAAGQSAPAQPGSPAQSATPSQPATPASVPGGKK